MKADDAPRARALAALCARVRVGRSRAARPTSARASGSASRSPARGSSSSDGRGRLGARLPAAAATSSAGTDARVGHAGRRRLVPRRDGQPGRAGRDDRCAASSSTASGRVRARGRRASSPSSAASRAAAAAAARSRASRAPGFGLKPSRPLFSVVVTAPVVRRSQTVRAACPARGAARRRDSSGRLRPDAAARRARSAAPSRSARSVVEGVVVARVTSTAGGGPRALVQVRALCTRAR